MPNNKRQHFVPVFYLELFSVGGLGKQIGLYNVRSAKFVPEAPLVSQAYKPYFYGKDGRVEEALSKLEGVSASIISNILSNNAIHPHLDEEYRVLINFVIFQRARTDHAVAEQNEMVDKMTQATIGSLPQFKGRLDKYQVRWSNPVAMSLDSAARHLPLVADLTYKVLHNTTELPFITSDNPVFLYNQFLRSLGLNESTTGLACKGLQMFLPLSPHHLLAFYDPGVYSCGARGKSVIQIDMPTEVDVINRLQCINAHENVYFNNNVTERYIQQLVTASKPYRLTALASVVERGDPTGEDGNHHLLQLCTPETRFDLRLACFRIQKKARAYQTNGRLVHVRNEGLCRLHQKFSQLVQDGKYKATEFTLFLKQMQSDREAK